jgi:hypothetical protein
MFLRRQYLVPQKRLTGSSRRIALFVEPFRWVSATATERRLREVANAELPIDSTGDVS